MSSWKLSASQAIDDRDLSPAAVPKFGHDGFTVFPLKLINKMHLALKDKKNMSVHPEFTHR